MIKMKKLVVTSNKANEWNVLEEEIKKMQEEQMFEAKAAVDNEKP